MVGVISGVRNHNAQMLPALRGRRPEVPTMKNITSFYAWNYTAAGRCNAYCKSGQEAIARRYRPGAEAVAAVRRLWLRPL